MSDIWTPIQWHHPAIAWTGTATVETTPEGLLPLRFCQSTLAAMEKNMARISRMGTGIELHLAGKV